MDVESDRQQHEANSSLEKCENCLYKIVTSATFMIVMFGGLSLLASGTFKEQVNHDEPELGKVQYSLRIRALFGLSQVVYSILGQCLCYIDRLPAKESIFQMMLRTVYRLGFLPSLSYNVVLNKLNVRPWYNRVDDRVIIGALPWISIKDELIEKENVRGVVSMNENFELELLRKWVVNGEHWTRSKVDFLQLQTQDIFETPSQDKLKTGVEFIMSVADGQSVYVHCKAGRTRSATLVCCYLMKRNNWTPQQAYNLLAEKRPQLALHKPQWRALHQFYEDNLEKM